MLETIGYDKTHKDRPQGDYYCTPPEEVQNILEFERLTGPILEPCCGGGHIAGVVKQIYPKETVIATDLYDRGYGQTGTKYNFLSPSYPVTDINSIIMNPPFNLITPFVCKALDIAKCTVLLLARLQFLESKERFEQIFKTRPPARVYVYVDRISCGRNGILDPKRIASMSYAWFVWETGLYQKPQIHFIRKYEHKLEGTLGRLWD